ncbi:UNVERIFIED_CONTAM: hypothetical protein FKN15_063961 [Acipenser sinensis]
MTRFLVQAQLLYGQPWQLPAHRDLLSQTRGTVVSRSNSSAALGLDPECRHLSHLMLSNRVILTLKNTRAGSTYCQYGYKWGVFLRWCKSRALNAYLAAISACHN